MKQQLFPQFPAAAYPHTENPEFFIVPGATAESDNVHALFRRKIVVGQEKNVTLFIASCGHYFFTVNGFYGSGPVRSTDYHIFYDSYDLSQHLSEGENLLEIIPRLSLRQWHEIAQQLVSALEIGEYAVSNYILYN